MSGQSNAPAGNPGNRLSTGDILILVASVLLLAGMLRIDGGPTYSTPPDFAAMTIDEKKREFFAFLSPMVTAVNFELQAAHERVRRLRQEHADGQQPGWFDRRWLVRLAGRLEVPIDELAMADALAMLEHRAGVVPESIVLVQAAVESGWGTSRFAEEGNNYFGQRCYREACGMQPQAVSPDAGFGLARYPSVQKSVESYMLNLNTHPEYDGLRGIRQGLRQRGEPITGLALVPGLGAYSERGEDYVAEIAAMIRDNGLE